MARKMLRYLFGSLILLQLLACNIDEMLRPGSTIGQDIFSAQMFSLSNCTGEGMFWARDLRTNASYCVKAQLKASGTHADIYVESQLITSLNYADISNEFDSKIYPRLEIAFGSAMDLDSNGKIIILILDIRDGSQPGGSFVAGFFDPVNFFDNEIASLTHSNRSDMLYMDGVELVTLSNKNLSEGKPDAFLATLSHEYQHLIRFGFEIPHMGATGLRDETWINEGSSEVAADIAGYAPQGERIKCYRGNIAGTCARGVNGSSLFGSSRYNSVVDYAFSYPFMKYIYVSSGSTEGERNIFLKATVQGITGSRAADANGLFEVFRKSSPKYSAASANVLSALGPDSASTFRKMFASFLWQSLGDTTPAEAKAGDPSTTGTDILAQMNSVIGYFPFPASGQFGAELNDLYSPLRLPDIPPLSTLAPGQFHFIRADRTNANASNGQYLLKKSFSSVVYSLQVNTEPFRNGDISLSVGLETPSEEPEGFHLPDTGEFTPVCPQDFIHHLPSPYRTQRFRFRSE
ncbi:peptidase M30 [Leptospira perolatii]|uniref:Peptidase M30 n=1 Tax=Leptospira perolatii TaxID=2023191 RepID=A0A2M9ZP34_9LEPT|nr:peptidase M30 [Leptospira perolatii]PJZ70631.1 peptidase M30 [Leptospira perolatii]PJZ73842.1 peptidase M30 [Leptospira perolatii]